MLTGAVTSWNVESSLAARFFWRVGSSGLARMGRRPTLTNNPLRVAATRTAPGGNQGADMKTRNLWVVALFLLAGTAGIANAAKTVPADTVPLPPAGSCPGIRI